MQQRRAILAFRALGWVAMGRIGELPTPTARANASAGGAFMLAWTEDEGLAYKQPGPEGFRGADAQSQLPKLLLLTDLSKAEQSAIRTPGLHDGPVAGALLVYREVRECEHRLVRWRQHHKYGLLPAFVVIADAGADELPWPSWQMACTPSTMPPGAHSASWPGG